MQKWEYWFEVVGDLAHGVEAVNRAIELGQNGWELVSVVSNSTGGYTLAFKKATP